MFVQKCHKYFMHDNDNVMCRFFMRKIMKFKTECNAREKFNHSDIILLLQSTGKRGNTTKNGTHITRNAINVSD